MADRHPENPLPVRLPPGLRERVEVAAKADGVTRNAFIVAAIEARLRRRKRGSTTAVIPHASAPVAALEDPPQQARRHKQTCSCLMCKPPKERKQ
jgi:hypothetical protein